MDLQKTGKFIAEMRKKKGLTQSDLGEALGLSGKAISKWERGINAPDISLLTQLSKILQVSITEILTGGEIEEEISTDDADEIAISSIHAYNAIFKKKYIKIICILISILFLIFLLFSTIYFITNYNKCFVYKLSSGSDKFYLEGLIASNQKENSVIITGMGCLDTNECLVNDNNILNYEIELYLDKILIIKNEYDNVNRSFGDIFREIKIVSNESQKISRYILQKNNINNMKIVIKYTTTNELKEKINIPVKIEKKFSNNKLFY